MFHINKFYTSDEHSDRAGRASIFAEKYSEMCLKTDRDVNML